MFPLEQEYLGERLQTLFAGYLGPGTALGLVGQIDIFEFGGIPTVVDALLQFECQFVQIGDGLEYRLFTLLDLLKPFILVADSSNLYFIESACAFLAIPGDKGNGAALVEQRQSVADSPFLQVELLGYQSCKAVLFHTIR